VTIPPGTTYGSFSVTANGLTAESTLGFIVTFPVRTLNPSAFGTPSIFSPGTYPSPTEIADLDGDGRPDLVEVNHFNIKIYRNDGTGNVAGLFTLALNLPASELLGDMRLSDMDGDGRLDIVAMNYSESSVSVFRNTTTNGVIGFAPRMNFPHVDVRPYFAVADLDGDGRADIITPNFTGGYLRVLRNTGGPGTVSFAPPVDLPTMANPSDIAVQDLDGDGKPEIAVLHHVGSITALEVRRNVTTPGVINSNSFPVTTTLNANGNYLAIADLDSDGRPDLVAGAIYTHNLTVFQNLSTNGNLGGSAFGPPVTLPTAGVTKRIAVSDLDGDGRLDLIAATELSDSVGIFRNRGGANGIDASWFAPRFDLAAGWNADGVSISDLDLDGLPDILFCSLYDHEVWIYRGVQPLPPTPPAGIQITGGNPLSGPAGTAVTLTGGGFSPTAGSNIVFISGLRATVTAATTSNLTFIVPPGATYGPITVTVNGSSVQSLLSFTTTFPPRTLDASAFDSPVTFSPGDGPIATRVADLDGDGRPDLAVAHHYANTVAVYRNNGTGGVAGVFSPKIDFPTGENPFDLHLEDLNGDGKLEMIVMNYSSDSVSIFRNTSTPGNISFAPRLDFPVSGHAHNGAVGDVDGDGKPDIAVAVYIQGKIAVLRNTSGPSGISFASPVDFTSLPEAHDVGIQDLDGDGKADIVVTRHSPGTPAVTVLRNVSQPGIINEDSLEFATELNADGTYVVFADFDGDGRQDIVTCSWYAHSVTLFQNFSTPGHLDGNSFGSHVTLPSAGSTKRIAVADLDGDGRVDLAFPTELGDSLGIYRNVGGTDEIDASWFAPRVDLASGWNGDGVSIGDINLDGLPDIIFCSFYIDEIWIYRGIRLTAPEIVTQPANVTIALGATASLVVQATGGGLHYSWYHDGALLLNATSATLEIANAHGSDAGSYFVTVSNSGGAVTSAVVTMTVSVDRTLALGAIADVDEGGLVSTPLTLASSGEVGGIDFVVHYNATYLAIPEIIWDDSLNNALKEFSVSQPGKLRGVIALPATGIPAGTQTLATVQFRARTVNDTNAHVSLTLQLSDMSDPLGDPIVGGTEVLGAAFDIHDTGFLTGDNNANHQLDVGDAALLMRLLAQLDSTRAWDIPANDFNLNDRLDSGDVIKMLRAIAGIDAPPAGAAPSGRTKSLSSEIASLSPARLPGSAGQLVTWQVRLDSLNTRIAGASFTLSYPVEALRLRNAQGHRVGTAVPGGTPAVWNVGPAQTNYATQNGLVTLALSGSSAWIASNTVLAEFTFEVQPGAANRYLWPLRIQALEVTGNGFNNRTLGPITAAFVGRSPVSGTMTRISVARPGDVSFNLSGDPGANYRIEFSEDLIHWTFLREVPDHTGTIQIIDSGAGSRPQRFYRSVPLP
ncbi:MAG TPA: FG-GAP-like repeat-containing protein, partial [Verrucomicrobiae bacterium]